MGVHAGMHAYSWEFKNHSFEKKKSHWSRKWRYALLIVVNNLVKPYPTGSVARVNDEGNISDLKNLTHAVSSN